MALRLTLATLLVALLVPAGYKPTFLWSFGDGTASVDENPEHTYAAPGTYTVKLVVTDTQGQKGERRRASSLAKT